MSDKIKFFALGGLDEHGKNMFVIEINEAIFVLDAGIKYPDARIPGIDIIIPNFDYLKTNKERVVAYLISHGHDDQMGALPYLYQEIPAPIYCSSATATMIKDTTKEYGLKIDYNFKTVNGRQVEMIANHKVTFIPTTHAIPGSFCFAIDTDQGAIVYTSDFIVDYGAPSIHKMDIQALSKVADKGCLLLLAESTNADKPGYTSPNHRLTPHISAIFTDSPGRIFLALYSQNIYNIQEVLELAIKNNKKVIFYDDNSYRILSEIEGRTPANPLLPKANLSEIEELTRLRDQDVVVLITGSGEKMFNTLATLGTGVIKDKKISFQETDTFIIACPAVSGTETKAIEAIDELYKTGAKVINLGRKTIYSMHAQEEDLKMIITLLHPKYYLPIKGDFKNLMANAKIALNMNLNYSHSNIFIFDNGMTLNIENGIAKPDFNTVQTIKPGDTMVDGIDVGNIGSTVIKERQKMSSDGVIILGVTVSSKTKEIVASPDIQMRGFIFLKEQENIVKEISNIFLDRINAYLTGYYESPRVIEEAINERILRFVRKETGKNPLILPTIIDLDLDN